MKRAIENGKRETGNGGLASRTREGPQGYVTWTFPEPVRARARVLGLHRRLIVPRPIGTRADARRLLQRNPHREPRPALPRPPSRLIRDRPVVLVDDLLHDRQAQAAPVLLSGGREQLEQPPLHLHRDAR